MTIDVSAVEAIDVHVHAEVGRAGEMGCGGWRAAATTYFGEHALPTADGRGGFYRERKLAAVIFTVDAETVTRAPGGAERGDRRSRGRERTCSSRYLRSIRTRAPGR